LTSEKIRIVREAYACTEKGAVNALLRREGIYSSHLSTWRRQRAAGQFGDSPRKRGPVPTSPDPKDKEIIELERRAVRADVRADRAERLCALPKKVSELFGLELPDPQRDEAHRERDEAMIKLVADTSSIDGIEATCDVLGVSRVQDRASCRASPSITCGLRVRSQQNGWTG
jgi:hypothetical protein